MAALDRKLGRDLRRLWGQVFTTALVLGCGVMAMLMLRSTWNSLVDSREEYYAQERFADVFVRVERAPNGVARRVEALPGVARVHTRIVEEVMVPMPGEPDPIRGRIVSVPTHGIPPLNGVYLRSGRMPSARAPDEAVVLEQFARAHGLRPGDRLPAVMGGSTRDLLIVGVGMSPEFLFALPSGAAVADERKYAVLWMARDAVAPAFEMDGAFNDLSLALQPGASEAAVLTAVDRELEPYGGFRAVARAKHPSHYALQGELDNLRNLALMIPTIFLGVAAFLVNVVISRLIRLERTQIAVLKAVGYSDFGISVHYLRLVSQIVLFGAVIGVGLGVWSGRWMTNMYTDFFKFPRGGYRVGYDLISATIAIALVAAVAGALGSVRRIVHMPPAESMRPPAPLVYRRTILDRLGLPRIVGASASMVIREINRRPFRFLMSTAGIAMGIAIFVMGRFSWDSFEYLFRDVFPRQHHEDLIVTFNGTKPNRVVGELEAMPGVSLAEGLRVVPVRVRSGSRWRDLVVTGLEPRAELRRLLHAQVHPLQLPPHGIVVTDKLAEILGVAVGDTIDAEILEGDRESRTATVVGFIDESFGLQVYARADWLARWLHEEPRVTGAFLRVDPRLQDRARERLKEFPGVLGVTRTRSIVENYEKQTGESMSIITLILTLSAGAIAVGIVYNNARIALSMRARDLATLRVLGFTRAEISAILMGELGVQVLLAIPLGLALGTGWAVVYARAFDPEVFRLPVHIEPDTYGTAAAIALASGILSALLVRRRLDSLDLLAVLKLSE